MSVAGSPAWRPRMASPMGSVDLQYSHWKKYAICRKTLELQLGTARRLTCRRIRAQKPSFFCLPPFRHTQAPDKSCTFLRT
eukprot:4664129-Alexandrium_andersonii.AAC.1